MSATMSLGDGDPRVAALGRMKLYAAGALLAALSGLVVSVLAGPHGYWPWVRAFCEAAAVGAMADWFAVVALFRRPLGLPIPHTALIPEKKASIADSLALFVRDQFLSPEQLLQKIEVFNPAARLSSWLSQKDNVEALTSSARTMALEALSFVDDVPVKNALNEFVVSKARGWDASSSAADVIDLLTKDGRHHQLLDAALERVADYLQSAETRAAIATKLVGATRREYPKIVAIVDTFYGVDKLGGSLAEKVARELVDEVQEALSDREHSVRDKYERSIRAFVDRLRNDELFKQKVNRIKNNLAESRELKDYVSGLWSEVRAALDADLRRADSVVIAHLRSGLEEMAKRIAHDPSLAASINQHVMSASKNLVVQLRSGVTDHIANTVKSWSDSDLVRQIELGVGRDLQFIRLNGTLVGGLIGLALHAALSVLHS